VSAVSSSSLRVLVCGDVTVDWNVARVEASEHHRAWTTASRVTASRQPGGAALLAEVLRGLELATVRGPDPAEAAVQSYALWSRVADRSQPKGAWRVDEHLGVDLAPCAAGVAGDDQPADVLVVDDAAFGFRDDPSRWPLALRELRGLRWVVVKTSAPVAQGALWAHLLGTEGPRLVIVMTVGDLRRSDVQVSRELSWERSAQDLVWELNFNPLVDALPRRATVVVSFGAAGALVTGPRPGGDAPAPADLVLDPKVVEGMWEGERPGTMIGATVALTAGLVREILTRPDDADLLKGTAAGLHALRALHSGGYAVQGGDPDAPRLAFPTARVVAALEEDASELSVAPVPHPGADRSPGTPARFWTILRDQHEGSLAGVARRVVLEGADAALGSVPVGRFGALVTVDRREIEAFREIGALVGEYVSAAGAQPVSIAVFGAPGSGKSFGVKQVATAIVPPSKLTILTFNVAEFDSAHDLVDALHQVRDAGLRGKLPLVFWDEFDTSFEGQPRGWLRHFLAPMQDGEFREGQIVHPIGRSVFVFAGGTASTLDEFQSGGDPAAFRAAKGPDFVSRLRGFVNVLGPDPTSPDDPYFVVRRAILLRSMLQRHAPKLLRRHGGAQLVDIDPGVLRAFLEVPAYKHGARSMESIITTSRLKGLDTFERSSLPAAEQLDLHVVGAEFLALVEEPELTGGPLEKLSRTAHEVYCDGVRARGYSPGAESDDEARVAGALRPWEELDETLREANRANVQDIPAKLARIGCVMVTSRGREAAFSFTAEEIEALARVEHERWVSHEAHRGDRLTSFLPWDELPESQRDKDRDMVRGIPAILARAGYAVLRVRAADTSVQVSTATSR
jgi:hypothetical protein